MKVKQTPVQSQILKNPESRRSFTEAFKRQAVELMESGRAVAQLARELEVSAFSLYEWKRKYGRPVDAAAVAPGNLGALQDENLALKAEVLRLRQREEILKKTLGILSEPSSNAASALRR
jgi:transposase